MRGIEESPTGTRREFGCRNALGRQTSIARVTEARGRKGARSSPEDEVLGWWRE